MNYYSGCSNYSTLRARVLYILKYSCALTFASKLRLKTKRKVFSRFNFDLAVRPDGNGSAKGTKGLKAYYKIQNLLHTRGRKATRYEISQKTKLLSESGVTKADIPVIFDEKTFPKSAPGFNKDVDFNINTFFNTIKNLHERTTRLLDAACALCSSTENIEMHHLKHVRKVGKPAKTDFLTNAMVKINRKQIPLCQLCHNKIHAGDGPALNMSNITSQSWYKNKTCK